MMFFLGSLVGVGRRHVKTFWLLLWINSGVQSSAKTWRSRDSVGTRRSCVTLGEIPLQAKALRSLHGRSDAFFFLRLMGIAWNTRL